MLGAPFAVDSTQLFMINHEVSGTGKWWIYAGPPSAPKRVGYFPDSEWGGSFTAPYWVHAFGEVAAKSTQPCARMGTGAFPTTTTGALISNVAFLPIGSAPAVDLTIIAPTTNFYRATRTSPTSLRYGGPGAFAGTPPADSTCTRPVPFVLQSSRAVADTAVRRAGLVPVFSGASGADAWVSRQSPAAGTMVLPGTTVAMTLQSGPIP